MFCGCLSLKEFPDISEWNTKNVLNMSYMFSSRHLLPEDEANFIYHFKNCIFDISYNRHSQSLKESFLELFVILGDKFFPSPSFSKLPDISKWKTNKVKNMSFMFENLKNIKYLPDISGWDTSNVENMKSMFHNCGELISLPDIYFIIVKT